MKFGLKKGIAAILTAATLMSGMLPTYAQEEQKIDVLLEDISAKPEALPILSGEAKIKISISGLNSDANIAKLALDFSGNMDYKAVQWLIEKESDVISSLQVIPDGDKLYLSMVFNKRVIKASADKPTGICILTFRGDPGESVFLSLIDDIDESYIEENYPATENPIAVQSDDEIEAIAIENGAKAQNAKVSLVMNKVTDFDLKSENRNINISIIGEDEDFPIVFSTPIEGNSNAIIPTLVVDTVLAAEQKYTVRIEGPGYIPYEKTGVSFEKALKVENDEFIPGELVEDGVIDIKDKREFEEILASGVYDITTERADFNRDGAIDSKDAKVYAHINDEDPYFEHKFLNEIKIGGADEVYISEQDVMQSVSFATDKDIMYLMGSIKFPENMVLEKIETKDFIEVFEDLRVTEDGYTTVTFTGIYDYEGNYVPKGETINPFDLVFDVTTEMKVGSVTIEIIGASMVGEEAYEFEETVSKTITVLPKLAESVEIVGADEIDSPTHYTALVMPDYTTDKSVEWSVDDESIASIDETGILTPLKNGTVTITATAKDGSGVFATKTVSVIAYAKINALTANVGTWSEPFDTDIFEYTIYVKDDVSTITLTPTFSGGGVLRPNGSGIWVSNNAKSFNILGDTTVITLNRQNVTNMTNSEYKITVVKSENSVINVSADKTMVEVFAVGAENGNVVMLALYKENRFVGMEKAIYDGQRIVFEPKMDYDSAKVMVWEDFETFVPVTAAEDVEL